MKAIILCAGLGTRLARLGLSVPKVMVPIDTKPLLEHHLNLLTSQGVQDVAINLHWMPDIVKNYFGDGKKFGVSITYFYEPTLRGTSGAIDSMREWISGDRVVIFYGDNLTDFNITPLLNFHIEKKSKISLALYESNEPWTGGVVETDSNDRLLTLVEKPAPEQCKSNTISSGIFIMEPNLLDFIPRGQFSDFGKDIFPKLLENKVPFFAKKFSFYIQDIGTPERYLKAQEDFKNGLVRL